MRFMIPLVWRTNKYQRPIHTTDNMPDDVVLYGAIAGLIFLALIFYSNSKERKKRKYKAFKYNQDRYWDNGSNYNTRDF